MTSNQIEAARVAINRHLKRKGRCGFAFFHTSLLQKNLLKLVKEKAIELADGALRIAKGNEKQAMGILQARLEKVESIGSSDVCSHRGC